MRLRVFRKDGRAVDFEGIKAVEALTAIASTTKIEVSKLGQETLCGYVGKSRRFWSFVGSPEQVRIAQAIITGAHYTKGGRDE